MKRCNSRLGVQVTLAYRVGPEQVCGWEHGDSSNKNPRESKLCFARSPLPKHPRPTAHVAHTAPEGTFLSRPPADTASLPCVQPCYVEPARLCPCPTVRNPGAGTVPTHAPLTPDQPHARSPGPGLLPRCPRGHALNQRRPGKPCRGRRREWERGRVSRCQPRVVAGQRRQLPRASGLSLLADGNVRLEKRSVPVRMCVPTGSKKPERDLVSSV